jgi:hypothetical protein
VPTVPPEPFEPPIAASSPDPAIVDLLGALAYGELSAFDRLSADARLAPAMDGRVVLSRQAVLEFGHYEALAERLTELGVDPHAAMAPFVAALDEFHALTSPSNWLECLVKAYVGDGLAADFYREVAEFVDPATRELIVRALDDTGTGGTGGSGAFAVGEVRAAIAENPVWRGRLALWGRRLVGEALSQTQHVLAERDSLVGLLMSGTGDVASVQALTTRITDKHSVRMVDLGLE